VTMTAGFVWEGLARQRGRSAKSLTSSLHRDDSEFVVLCFARPEDAEAFAKRFGESRLPVTGGEITTRRAITGAALGHLRSPLARIFQEARTRAG
jgi:hypothetical protein